MKCNYDTVVQWLALSPHREKGPVLSMGSVSRELVTRLLCHLSEMKVCVWCQTHILHVFLCSRGKGPLKNSSDVINAAKKIAEAGSRMDKLARAVADQVALHLNSCLSSLSLLFFPDLTFHTSESVANLMIGAGGGTHLKLKRVGMAIGDLVCVS